VIKTKTFAFSRINLASGIQLLDGWFLINLNYIVLN